ncbi:MAG TPA: hypothetical protein VFB81_24110 [Myxococcales bacterium]|nr:hypothetical protein [Myxococcales bacterium]
MPSGSRRWCALALAVLGAVPLTGCHRVAFHTRLPRGDEVREKVFNYWAFGAIGEHEVDLDAMCPSGVASWRVESIAWVDILTLGVYTPRRVVAECAGVKK